MLLLDPSRTDRRWGGWETGAFALYLAVVAFGIAQHVPWADESQAWMLAQEVPLPALLVHGLHYEGTPGLWHSLLKLLLLLHLSFTGARWVGGAIAAAGVAVLLACAPFPRIIRLLLPFSFFLAYQDAVVARSYVLFAIFAFTSAALLRSPRPRPVLFALVVGLMANISLHAALASGGLALVAARLWRTRLFRSPVALGLLVAFWGCAIATMAPAADIDFSAGNNAERSIAKFEKSLGFEREAPPPINTLSMGDMPPAATPVHARTGLQSTWNKLSRTLSVVTYPLAVSRALALLLVGLVVAQACAHRRRIEGAVAALPEPAGPPAAPVDTQARPAGAPTGPVGLTPYLLSVAVFTSVYLAPRHAGMVFTCFVISAWLTWPAPGTRSLLARATTAVFALVIALQIGWTFRTLAQEHMLPYSPDKMAADYLREQGAMRPGSLVAGYYYYSVGPLLYFDRPLYENQPRHRYWSWSTRQRTSESVQQTLARHPDFIVVGGFDQGPDGEITRDWQTADPPQPGILLGDRFHVVNYFNRNGYHEARRFCGTSWMRSTYAEHVCLMVLEPDSRRPLSVP